MSDEQVVVKKPIWKKWWFWGIIIVFLIAIGSSGGDDQEAVQTSSQPTATDSADQQTQVEPEKPDNSIKSGMYKIGTDLPAGEYVLIGSGYFEIASNSSGTLDSIVANDNYVNRTFVTISDGQYFKFSGGKRYPITEAPSVDTSSGILEEGMYKVGLDIPAGEYKVEANSGMAYIEVSSKSTHSLYDIVSNDNFSDSRYITASDGQYLKVSSGKIYLN